VIESVFDWSQLAKYKAAPFLPGYPDDFKTFFSPGDPGVHQLIVDLLKSAQNSIVLNMFGFDDDEADSVIQEKLDNEHIYVQMSLDRSQAGGVHEAAILAKWSATDRSNSIAIGTSIHHAISHLKVCIVDGVYTMTGSTNWSLSGEQLQDNQLTLHKNAIVAAEYRTVLDINHAAMLKQMAARAPGG
jgi:hypothetical protein